MCRQFHPLGCLPASSQNGMKPSLTDHQPAVDLNVGYGRSEK